MITYDITDGTKLPDILRLAVACGADRLLVSGRPAIDAAGRASFPRGLEQNVARIFRGKLEREVSARAWPGTRLSKGKGRIFVVRFDDETIERIILAEPDLFSWTHQRSPPLPEDMCVFSSGAHYPFLVSVTHESDAWLLTERPVRMGGIAESRFRPDDLMLPQTANFCTI